MGGVEPVGQIGDGRVARRPVVVRADRGGDGLTLLGRQKQGSAVPAIPVLQVRDVAEFE